MNPWIPHLLRASGRGSTLPRSGQTFYASLKTSLVPDVGTGGPTWSRATAAWRLNDIGYLRQIPSGCAEFGGARLVTNLCPTPSNTLAVAGTKTVTLTAAATLQFSMGAGTGTATFSGTGGATGTLAAGASRVSVNKTVTAGTFVVTASVADLVDLSIVDVTGRDASYIPEYVSVGSAVGKSFFLHTDDFSQAAWIKSNVTTTQAAIANPVNGLVNAQKVEVTTSTNVTFYQDAASSGLSSGNIFVVYVKQGSGATDANSFIVRNNTAATNILGISFNYSTGAITYNTGSTGASAVALPNGWWKLQMVVTSGISNGNTLRLYIGYTGLPETAGEHLYVYRPYAGQGTTAPDVIPVVAGVWDAHGSGADGSKYFATDWQGAPIPVANLTRLRKESSATNALLSSRNLSQHHGSSFATKRWQVSETTGSELLANNSFDSGLTSWTTTIGSGGTISATGGQCTFISDGGTVTSMSNTYQLVAGESYVFTMVASGSGTIKLSNNTVEIAGFGAGTSTISFVAGSTQTFLLSRSSGVACNLVIDSVSIKLAAVKTEQTATGLDGIANSASTLTATSANAIILQPTSGIASAARCASAYVKRVTGTGTISFTQDGGSTWTDITSQLNTSTYSRVQTTATLANPSVGFKISTSGDAIDVDCVQNEAGSVATSPIVTTTTTVNRNTDSLRYQASGNIDFATGTWYSSFKSSGYLFARYAFESASGYSYINSTGPNTSWASSDGSNVVTKTGLDDIAGGFVKRAIAWGGSTQKITGNGATPASGVFDGTWGSGTDLTIASVMYGSIGDVAIYNYKMTDAELQAITT